MDAPLFFLVVVRLLSGRCFTLEVRAADRVEHSVQRLNAVFNLYGVQWDLAGPAGRLRLTNNRTWAEHGVHTHCELQLIVMSSGL